jgi:hypothetical protein
MTRFTPKFFGGGTRVLQKQGTHSRLGELIVHLGVTGLANLHPCISFFALFGFLVLLFCRCFGETEKGNHHEKDKGQYGYEYFAHSLPVYLIFFGLWILGNLAGEQAASKKSKFTGNAFTAPSPYTLCWSSQTPHLRMKKIVIFVSTPPGYLSTKFSLEYLFGRGSSEKRQKPGLCATFVTVLNCSLAILPWGNLSRF